MDLSRGLGDVYKRQQQEKVTLLNILRRCCLVEGKWVQLPEDRKL
jgi:hypothetical protein